MDALEIARQIAARLHAEAVGRGLDPWAPFEFAKAEAERRGIDIEPSAPGAAMLDGARAVFLPDAADRIILYEDVGSDFEKAFLICHELGHVELGDDRSPCEIDLTRSSEAAPVGSERVIDHNRRKRREVQMDLFAREFLLPRDVARELHIDGKMSAAPIAKKLGAPYDMVAQQLFDALLLPPVVAEDRPERPPPTLNDAQRDAVLHRGVAYLLKAGPGTGKTQTLTARVSALVENDVDPRSILVLTFSNKAAGEMSDRIAARNPQAAAAMWIGTFHAFGLDLLRRFGDRLGISPGFRMIDRAEQVELLENEFPRLGLVHYRDLYDPTSKIADLLDAISRAKDEVVGPERYAELAAEMAAAATDDESRLAAQAADEVARVYARYEVLKGPGRIDFGDLVMLPTMLLETDETSREHFAATYAHVLVDEYQDVNRASVRLLKQLRPQGTNLWAVGDIRQSIYRFRGASSHNMDLFETEDFPGAKSARLKVNYRSMREIIDTFTGFAKTMDAGDKAGTDLCADRGRSLSLTQLRTTDIPGATSALIADAVAEQLKAGHPYRDQAVLCSGNDRLADIGRDLEALGVPVLYLGSLLERPEIKDLLSILSLLTDPRGMGLVRTACLAEYPMDLADLGAALNALRDEDTMPPRWLSGAAIFGAVSPSGQASLASIARVLAGFDANSAPWSVLAAFLLDRTDVAQRLASSTKVAERSAAIAVWQFMNFLRTQPSGKGLRVPRFLARVRRLLRLSDERDLRHLPAAAQGIDAVRLMTIHGAKGLEFPVVHLPGMNISTLPRSCRLPACPAPQGMIAGATGTAEDEFRAGHDEEQQCIFYVGLSRARDRLILYAENRTKTAKRSLSPFIDQCGPSIERCTLVPSQTLPPSPDTLPIKVEAEGRRYHASQLALYRKCPRRFFYTHVLRIGGRREMSPFMLMHEAVRVVVDEVTQGGSFANDAALARRIADECAVQGIVDDGYVEDYRGFATAMVRFFIGCRDGHQPQAKTALSLKFGEDEVLVTPDEMLIAPDGGMVLRRCRSGHHRKSDDDDIAAAALLLAAAETLPGATVEIVYLADELIKPVEITQKKLETRRGWIGECLQGASDGLFRKEESSFTCPGCPALIICGAVPPGTLKIIS
jgi:superfamily I DNA/RNA helicase/Zn-dependent peptidase ImmA (M78 family)